MTPFLDDGDVRLYHGDALTVLRELPAESVHCCVTSPPFYGLRDYGTGRWEGGDEECDHLKVGDPVRAVASSGLEGGKKNTGHIQEGFGANCGKCGARRVDQQIGLEETPEQWVQALVAVFREVRRVLRPDGTLWLEVGDSYSGSSKAGAVSDEAVARLRDKDATVPVWEDGGRPYVPQLASGSLKVPPGCKPKDLILAPAMLAMALRADGWWLRSDIVWARPNPMPESVTDRPTKSHSYIFLLSKSPRYFFDQEAVRESASENTHARYAVARETPKGREGHTGWDETTNGHGTSRNVRSVWTIPTQPFSDWKRTVRQVGVEPDAGVDGKRRITSPDCPAHGDRPAPAPTAPDGERADGGSSRSEHSDAGPVQGHLVGRVPTGPTLEPATALGSSGSPLLSDSPTATARSTGSRKTASRSTSGGTPAEETPGRTEDTSPSSGTPEPDGSGSHGSSETPDRTSHTCTCAWEFTENISHFATFPEELARRCILAGSSERGCCPECGATWVREVERELAVSQATERLNPDRNDAGRTQFVGARAQTLGWRPSCECVCETDAALAPTSPCVVLDPFVGSGTVPYVARKHGRHAIGIDLSSSYLELAARRLQQLSLFAEAPR